MTIVIFKPHQPCLLLSGKGMAIFFTLRGIAVKSRTLIFYTQEGQKLGAQEKTCRTYMEAWTLLRTVLRN